MKRFPYRLDVSVLKRLLPVLILLGGVLVLGIVGIRWLTKDADQTISLELQLLDEATQTPLSNVEVHWLNEYGHSMTISGEDGKVFLTVSVPEGGGGNLSISHSDYRPQVKSLVIPADAVKDGKYQVPAFELHRLYAENQVQEGVLSQITKLRQNLRSQQSLLEQKYEELLQVKELSLRQVERKVRLENQKEQLEFLSRTIREDSLLYILREIDQATILRSIDRAQAQQEAISLP